MISPLNKTTQELSFQKMYGSRLARSYKKRYSAKGSHVMKRKSSQKSYSVGRYRKSSMRRPSQAALQYARAIMNPNLTGGKIPDSYAQKTATVQLQQEYILNIFQTSVAPSSTTLPGTGYCLFAVSLGPNPCVHMLAEPSTGNKVFNDTAPTYKTTLLGNTASGKEGYTATEGLPSANESTEPVAAKKYKDIINTEGNSEAADQTILYRSLFKSSRLVSAGVHLEYSGTDASNQGVISVAYFDRDYFSALLLGHGSGKFVQPALDPELNKETADGAINSAGAIPYYKKTVVTTTAGTTTTTNTYVPVVDAIPATGLAGGLLDSAIFNTSEGKGRSISTLGTYIRNAQTNAFGPAKLGCKVRYYPKDEDDIEFCPLYTSCQSAHQLSRQFVNGGIVILAENMDPTATFVAKVTANMECTLRQDSINLVHSSTSPVDSNGIAGAANMWKRQPQIKIGGNFETLPLGY